MEADAAGNLFYAKSARHALPAVVPPPTGIMRGRFNPADSQLYVCGLYAWAGNRQHPGGFFRVRQTDKPLTIPVGLHAEPEKLDLEFAVPLDAAVAAKAGNWTLRAWDLDRTKKYGSPHLNERELPVAAAECSSDGRRRAGEGRAPRHVARGSGRSTILSPSRRVGPSRRDGLSAGQLTLPS